MLRKLIISLLLLFNFSIASKYGKLFLNEGFTENEALNIKLFTIRSLNLILDAYSSLSKKRFLEKEIYAYLDASLFFLNEASQYSPSFFLKREIESLTKRIKLYPKEDYSSDIRVLTVHTEELSAALDKYDEIVSSLKELQGYASVRNNDMLLEKLTKLSDKISIPLLDPYLNEAKNLIVVAKDHLKAKRYKKAKQALELAINPLILISQRENLYVILSKEYLSKAKYTLNIDTSLTKKYLSSAFYAINKAYLSSTEENRELLKSIKDKVEVIIKKYDSNSVSQKDLEDIINLINRL